MLTLVSQPENRAVKLQARVRGDRLKWQPVRETSGWKVQKLKEEWAEWVEWRDSVAERVVGEGRERERRGVVRKGINLREGERGAGIRKGFPGKLGMGGEVEIVSPGVLEGA